ncbi:DnaA N-terminal domain-containing protein [Niallia oryzisoli]|uniref:DnaA N-terminal domain-containing protein n=1 Tax=Niallia oryzisoli TaxID=1737571 RepID=UPI0037354430
MDLWTNVLHKISTKLSKPSFATWLKNTTADIRDDVITVKAHNEFQAMWIEERYSVLIAETVKEITGRTMDIRIYSTDEKPDFKRQSSQDDSSGGKDYVELKSIIELQQMKLHELESRIRCLESPEKKPCTEVKFVFFNDTGRKVGIHQATAEHGTKCDMTAIKPLEERIFVLPEGTYPWVKMWDYGEEKGLSLLVSPKQD